MAHRVNVLARLNEYFIISKESQALDSDVAAFLLCKILDKILHNLFQKHGKRIRQVNQIPQNNEA